jgi:ubiquinone/menaquinone biosynthesis C-methylase UbiE
MEPEDKKYKTSFSGKGVFPPKYAFTLLLPFRNIFLSPNKLIKRLDLREDFNVLEIGPGPGYFSVKVAKELKKGKLVLADIQQEMLDYSRKRLNARNINNVEYKLCNGKTLDFDNESFDRVFMVTVIGEVDNKREYLKEIKRIIKDEGVLSISELAGDPDKLSIEELKDLVCSEGFKIKNIFGTKRNYTMSFEKLLS